MISLKKDIMLFAVQVYTKRHLTYELDMTCTNIRVQYRAQSSTFFV